MTFNDKVRAALCAARDGLRLRAGHLAAWLVRAFPDLVGWVALVMLGRGIWLEFGEAWALMVLGVLLLALSIASALLSRGGE